MKALLIGLALGVGGAPTSAEPPPVGEISGKVTDERGDPLGGATVVATSPNLVGSRTTISGADGTYLLRDLPPGRYEVAFYFGDAQMSRSGVAVFANKASPVHVKFSASASGEKISIEAAPTIDPSSINQGITLGRDYTLNVPLAGPWTRETRYESDASEEYRDYGQNPFTDTASDRHSTFAIDVDAASYTIMRTKIRGGERPPPASVRVEEFLNYFRYAYEGPADAGHPFAVHMDAAPSPFSRGRTLLRIGVQAKHVAKRDRKPRNLVFLVDVSGSMASVNKLDLAKRSLAILVVALSERDTVALVTYAGATAVRLAPTPIAQREKILATIEELSSGGSTAMGAGIDLAYDLAARNLREGTVSRVIVLSDGDANVGATSHEAILETIASRVEEGVTLTTVGFGMGNYKDEKMEQLANKGNGNSYYIDNLSEARRIFEQNIEGTLEVVAKDVKIQVEFNPNAVKRYRLVGYENRDIDDDDFRDDKVDAGEIGAGHAVTALYELELADGRATLATVRIRSMVPRGVVADEAAYEFDRRDLHGSFDGASADFRFAAAVMAAAEILRNSRYAETWRMADVVRIARGAAEADHRDRQEFIELMTLASGYDRIAVDERPGDYQRERARWGHLVAGASFGSLIVRGEGDSNVAPISSLRFGYGRGATDITLALGAARSVAEATVARSTTPVGDSLSFYSLATVVSHRFLPGSIIHPVGGLGVESLVVAPSVGKDRMTFNAIGRVGLELIHATQVGALAFGFEAAGHLPLARSERMPMNIDSLFNLGIYIDFRP